MPGPGVQKGGKVVRRGTGGAPRQPRDTTTYTPTRQRVAPSRPVQAARQFVDHHVSIDKYGFPSLLPSAVQGITRAVESVRNPTNLPSATTSVVSASGQATRPTDPSVSVRMWKQMHGGGKPVEPPKPKPTTPSAYRQARQTEKQGEQQIRQQRKTFFSEHKSRPLSSYGLGEHISLGGYPKTYQGMIERQQKQLKKPPLFGHSEQTGGAYDISQAVGPGGSPVDRTTKGERGPVGTGFKVAGTIAQYAPLAATVDIGRGALKLGLSRAARTEAANVVKTEGVKGATSRVLPRLSQIPGAVKKAPGAIRKAPGAVRGAARRAPATVAITAGTSEGRVAAARTIAQTAYTHKAATVAALSLSAKQANAEPPGVKQVNAFLTGTKNALTNNPLHTLKTTARALPGAITAPVALSASGVESAIHGDIGPLKQEATTQFEGAFFHPGPKRGILEKMLSGDPKAVEKAVTNEGGLAFLPLVPGISRTGAYKGARGKVRGGASAARRAAEPILRDNRGKVLGIPIRPRVSPKGVERPVFRAAERRQEGLRIAKIRAREEGPYKLAAAEHGNAVVHAAGKLSKKMKTGGVPQALQTLLANGIHDKRSFDYIKKHGPKSEVVPEGGINFKAAMDIMEAHPEMWNDKRVQNLIEAGRKASDTTEAQMHGMGEVARVREQAAAHRNRYTSEGKPIPPELLHPTEHVPAKAKTLTKATTREAAWADVKALEKAGETKKAKALRQALDPYTRPEHSQDFATTSRTPYDNAMRDAHVKAVEAENAKAGLAPGRYTHHAQNHEAAVGLGQNPYPRAPGGQEHSSAASDNPESLAARDLVDRSLVAFVKGTVEMPRRRAGGKAFARGVTREAIGTRFPVKLEGETRNVVGPQSERMITREQYAQATSPKSETNPHGGQYDRKSMGFFPYNEVKNALDNPFTTEAGFAGLLEQASKHDATGPRGELGFLMPRRAIEEWRHQIQGDLSKLSRGMSGLAGVATAGILGTNPAWAMLQIPAEGIPVLMAHPSFIWRAPALEVSLTKLRKNNPEAAYWLEGSMGANPNRAGAVERAEQTTGGYGQQEAPNAETLAEQGKQLTRGPLSRAFDSALHIRPLRTFDVRRQREQSVLVGLTIADKRFRSWGTGLKDLVKRQSDVVNKFPGKTRDELATWLAETPEGRAEWRGIREDLYNTVGNWDAFTQMEREAAPFTIFYTFLRYAVQWPLWLFPRSHPVTATIAYFLAQQNANRLEKLTGMKHGLPSGDEYLYALPVYTTNDMKKGHYTSAVLPAGTRISPGQSVIQGSIMSKNPAQVLGTANPFVGAVVTGLTGTTPFGTQTTQPKGWAALNQLIPGLSALRYVPGLNAEKIVKAITTGHATNDPASIISQAFDRIDPERRLRSFAAPIIPLSGAKLKQREQLSNALKMAHDNNTAARQKLREDYASKVANAKGSEKHKLFNEGVLKDEAMHRKGTQAGDTIDRILSDLGLGVANKKSFAAYLGITKMSEPPFGQTPHRPTGPTTTSPGTPKPVTQATQAAFTTQPVKNHGGPLTDAGRKGLQLQLVAAHTGQKGATPAQAEADGAKAIKSAKTTGLPGGEGVFADTVSRLTGLSPRVVAAWTRAEGGNQSGDWNRLNIGHTDSGPNSAAMNSGWNDPKSAGKLTAQFLRGNYGGASPQIQQILASARGKSDAQQIQIIANSGWATDPAYQSKLQSVYNSVGGGAGPTSAKFNPTAPPALKQSFNKIVKVADNLSAAGIPYVWGGQHGRQKAQGPKTATGYDCSGAVSYILQKAGVKIPVLTSGALATDPHLKDGPGAVTIYANSGHVFMKIGNRYWGTSGSYRNASGPGWFNGTPSASYLSGFTARHVPGFGPKQAKQLGAKLVGGDTSGGLAGGAGGTGGGGVGGSSGGGGGLGGTVAGLSGGGLSSKYTPPDYVGLTASSHVLSPITGIIRGTGSSSTSSLIGGTRGTASSFPSASANLAKLPEMPKPRSRRRRSTTSLSSR